VFAEQFLLHLELMRDKVPDWRAYPFNIPALAELERLKFDRAVTFLVGENGSGKSTLIEAIAIPLVGCRSSSQTRRLTSRRASARPQLLSQHARGTHAVEARAIRWQPRAEGDRGKQSAELEARGG